MSGQGYILKVDARGFADKFDVEHERKRGGKGNTKIFNPSN